MEPSRASNLSEASDLSQSVSTYKRDDLCSQCVRISRHCVGKATRPYKASSEELLDYIRVIFADVFQLKGGEEILKQAEGIALPNLKLCVRIIQAEGLYTTEVEPVSLDTYGIVWVDELRKARTSVQRQTATPRWNEGILVDMDDWTKGSLTVEVWKKDPHSIGTSLRGFVHASSFRDYLRGLRNVLQTLCRHKEDDFLGKVVKPLADIPSVGIEQWYQLQDDHRSGLFGRLQMGLSFRTIPSAEQSFPVSLKDHFALSHIFLSQSLLQNNEQALQWNRWDDCISKEALTLLHQHSLHRDLKQIEKCYCYLLAVTTSRTRNEGRINYSVVYTLLKELQMELKDNNDQVVKESIDAIVAILCQQTRYLLSGLHDKFNLKDNRQALDLLGVLSCCTVVEAISQKGVTDKACEEIRKSAYEWHLKITVLGMPNITDDTFVKGLADVLHPISQFHNGANVIFKQAWNESYTEITIEELDNLLDTHFRPRIVALCALIPVSKKDDKDRLVEKSLDTFYLVQGFISNALSCLPVHRPHLSMDDYLYWFGPHIAAEWFEWVQRPALTWIERFVDGDTMLPISATDKIGSSARETSVTIQEQFMVLWKNLNWPNPSVATKFALIVSACALLFTQKTEEKVRRQKYFEVIGDYGVSTRLCVAINNITAIVTCLESIQRSIVECFHHDPQYDDALADLCAPVQKAADSIAASVLRLTDGVLLKIEPEITRLLENIVRCRDTSEQDRALFALSKYMNTCLSTLHANLEATAFRNALLQIWKRCVFIMKQIASKLQKWHFCRFRSSSIAFSGLLEALHRLRKIFHADGGGLDTLEVDSKAYQEFDEQLTGLVQSLNAVRR